MKYKYILSILFFFAVVAGAPASVQEASSEPESFLDYCLKSFLKNDDCPDHICEMKCPPSQAKDPKCVKDCLPKDCKAIQAKDCPLEHCAVMTDCSDNKICHYQMAGEKPACGDLSYGGQEVECCPGLVKRCGLQFLEGHCDMEGKNSIYNIPICIPCGDGICGQFEDRCNCPEDCRLKKKEPVNLQLLKDHFPKRDGVQLKDVQLNMIEETPPRIIEIPAANKPKK